MADHPATPTDASSGEIQAVTRAAQILALFGPHHPVLTVAQGASLLGLNRTTVNRYFVSLENAGLLQRSAEQSAAYEPSRLLYQLGAFALGRQRITEVGPPVMKQLAADLRLTVALSLWAMSGPIVVHVEQDDTWGASVTVRVGHQVAIDGAQTQTFLAFHPDRFHIERLLSSVPPVQRDELLARVATVRSSGLGRTTTPSGVTVVAAPIFGAHGQCATVAMVGTMSSLEDGRSQREEALLRKAALHLTDLMGGDAPPCLAGTATEGRT